MRATMSKKAFEACESRKRQTGSLDSGGEVTDPVHDYMAEIGRKMNAARRTNNSMRVSE